MLHLWTLKFAISYILIWHLAGVGPESIKIWLQVGTKAIQLI